jgi:hypothetical protein
MEHIYEKARPSSSEGSQYHDGSEEDLGFISEQPINTSAKHKYMYAESMVERLRTVSLRAVAEFFMGGLILILLVIIFVSEHRHKSGSASINTDRDELPRFGPSCTSLTLSSFFVSLLLFRFGRPTNAIFLLSHINSARKGGNIRKRSGVRPGSRIRRPRDDVQRDAQAGAARELAKAIPQEQRLRQSQSG